MKEILNSFEYLPRLSEFVKVCDTKNAINDTPITLMEFICQYTNFITQPLTKELCETFELNTTIIVLRKMIESNWTLEDAINAGVKLKLKG